MQGAGCGSGSQCQEGPGGGSLPRRPGFPFKSALRVPVLTPSSCWKVVREVWSPCLSRVCPEGWLAALIQSRPELPPGVDLAAIPSPGMWGTPLSLSHVGHVPTRATLAQFCPVSSPKQARYLCGSWASLWFPICPGLPVTWLGTVSFPLACSWAHPARWCLPGALKLAVARWHWNLRL